MIAEIARKEFTEMRRDGRFRRTALIVPALLVAALAAGSQKSKKSDGSGKRLRGGGDSEIRSFDIREKMRVGGSDNERLGTVDGVEYGEIKLTREGFAGQQTSFHSG